MQAQGGCLLTVDMKLFDHAFFGISGAEIATMDTAQRKILKVVYEAFENSGEPKEKCTGSKTSVLIRSFTQDHLLIQARD